MAEPLKNMYNRAFAEVLSGAVGAVHAPFDAADFHARLFDDAWEARELKGRMRHITHSLRATLPPAYRDALAILRAAAPSLKGYGFAPMIFPDFVEVYGLEDWDASLPALEQFTQQTSAEFAVRPFLLQDQPRMMAQMRAWAEHPSEHLRRLASEGSRPRLPWAMALPALKADPAPILPILDRLRDDESEYVRRSVANNLNDISKDNPDIVLEVLRDWAKDASPNVQRLTSHALRTLIKAGHPEALGLLGYANEAEFAVSDLTASESVTVGDSLTFAFAVTSHADTEHAAMIDYAIVFRRANGQPSRKVFKGTKRVFAPGETARFEWRHSFRPITTRVYYPGEHTVEVQVNGTVLARQTFALTTVV
jgi:3-methyladenine DNA glycosylase AlkC